MATVAFAFIIIGSIKFASAFLQPALIALLVTAMTWPLVRPLLRWGVPSPIVIALGIAFQVGLVASFTVLLTNTARMLTARAPVYRETLDIHTERVSEWFQENYLIATNRAGENGVGLENVVGAASSALYSIAGTVGDILLALLIAAFLLIEAAAWGNRLRELVQRSNAGLDPWIRVGLNVRRYFKAKAVTSAATGMLAGVLTASVGMPLPATFGVLTALLNFVPFVGSVLAGAVAVVVALLELGLTGGIIVLVGYVFINVLIGGVIEPRVFGHFSRLSPLVVLLSMLFWGWILGPIGAVLSVPLTTMFKLLAAESRDWSWIALLLGAPAKSTGHGMDLSTEPAQQKKRIARRQMHSERSTSATTGR
jgi:AI-2 transport protein TqsA